MLPRWGGIRASALARSISFGNGHSMDLKKTKELNNDGHYSETKSGMRVAYTRCWNWQKGFRGDPRAHQRMENTLMQSVPPQAVASAAPRPVPGALPTNSGSRSCRRLTLSLSTKVSQPSQSSATYPEAFACAPFLQSGHKSVEMEPAEPSPDRQTTWTEQSPAASTQTPPEPTQGVPPRCVPAAVANARFGTPK